MGAHLILREQKGTDFDCAPIDACCCCWYTVSYIQYRQAKWWPAAFAYRVVTQAAMSIINNTTPSSLLRIGAPHAAFPGLLSGRNTANHDTGDCVSKA